MTDSPDTDASGGSSLAYLTPAEKECIALLGRTMNLYASQVVGHAHTREPDLIEFATRIHDLQHAVMAQAAARAYPQLYRLAGESFTDSGVHE